MAVLSVVSLLAAATVAQAGIYPDGHWDHSTELTTDNADDFVKKNVDAGKTAPAWNKLVEDFKGNDEVAFGDVALSSNQVRTIHGTDQGAGAGGWPTVRHFNKGTGYGGKTYEKKTSEAMCDELGPKTTYLQQYIEEAGGTSLCSVFKKDQGCNDKQVAFIDKWADKPKEEQDQQLRRLEAMLDTATKDVKPDVLTWMKQRANIFKQFSKGPKKDEL